MTTIKNNSPVQNTSNTSMPSEPKKTSQSSFSDALKKTTEKKEDEVQRKEQDLLAQQEINKEDKSQAMIKNPSREMMGKDTLASVLNQKMDQLAKKKGLHEKSSLQAPNEKGTLPNKEAKTLTSEDQLGKDSSLLGLQQEKNLKKELPPFPENPFAVAGMQAPQEMKIQIAGDIRVDGAKLPQAMMDKIVQSVQVGATEKGGMQFQFEMKGDVLGGMKMNVSMEQGKLHISFLSEKPEVRKLLDESLKDLERSLEDKGLKIQELEVRDPKEQQREQQRRQSQKEREEFIHMDDNKDS